jgi:periplasmic divalent cation tolerance protein
MAYIDVYITYPGREEAAKVLRHLLKKRLVACGNIYPIGSIYWWRGKLVEADEFILLVKTRKEYWSKLKAEVSRTHPYEVPCISRCVSSANASFEKWLRDETNHD